MDVFDKVKIIIADCLAIDKEQRGKNWTAVKTSFSGKNRDPYRNGNWKDIRSIP